MIVEHAERLYSVGSSRSMYRNLDTVTKCRVLWSAAVKHLNRLKTCEKTLVCRIEGSALALGCVMA